MITVVVIFLLLAIAAFWSSGRAKSDNDRDAWVVFLLGLLCLAMGGLFGIFLSNRGFSGFPAGEVSRQENATYRSIALIGHGDKKFLVAEESDGRVRLFEVQKDDQITSDSVWLKTSARRGKDGSESDVALFRPLPTERAAPLVINDKK
jgi:hypothetical protein